MRIPPIRGISSIVGLSNLIRSVRNELLHKTRQVAQRALRATSNQNHFKLKGKKGRKVTSHRPDAKRASDIFKNHS